MESHQFPGNPQKPDDVAIVFPDANWPNVVMHGGDEGQLSQYGMPDQFVFERTFESLQSIDIG